MGQLLFRNKQFARPLFFVVEAVGLKVFRDMGVDQPKLATFGRSIGLGDLRLAQPQRLDLGAREDEAGLHGFANGIIVSGPAIFSHETVADHPIFVFVVFRNHDA